MMYKGKNILDREKQKNEKKKGMFRNDKFYMVVDYLKDRQLERKIEVRFRICFCFFRSNWEVLKDLSGFLYQIIILVIIKD